MPKRVFHCSRCKTRLVRNEKHDAYYCMRCDTWAEEPCGDASCEFCVGRPERPTQARRIIDCRAA